MNQECYCLTLESSNDLCDPCKREFAQWCDAIDTKANDANVLREEWK